MSTENPGKSGKNKSGHGKFMETEKVTKGHGIL